MGGERESKILKPDGKSKNLSKKREREWKRNSKYYSDKSKRGKREVGWVEASE